MCASLPSHTTYTAPAWGYHVDYAACSGHILHGWPRVHLYPWLKWMCPAAAVSCIIHDVSEFSTSWCLSVSTACPLSLPIYSPWMAMTRQRVHHTHSYKNARAEIDNNTFTCIHRRGIFDLCIPQNTETWNKGASWQFANCWHPLIR